MFENIVIGVLSSLTASLIFLSFMALLKPKIVFSDSIAKTANSDGTFQYQFKIINRSRFSAVDLRFSIYCATKFATQGGLPDHVHHLRPRRDCWFSLAKYDKRDPEANYALCFSTDEDIDGLWNDSAGGYLAVEVYAKHELSNFGAVFEKRYFRKSSIESGVHSFGPDLTISD